MTGGCRFAAAGAAANTATRTMPSKAAAQRPLPGACVTPPPRTGERASPLPAAYERPTLAVSRSTRHISSSHSIDRAAAETKMPQARRGPRIYHCSVGECNLPLRRSRTPTSRASAAATGNARSPAGADIASGRAARPPGGLSAESRGNTHACSRRRRRPTEPGESSGESLIVAPERRPPPDPPGAARRPAYLNAGLTSGRFSCYTITAHRR